FQTMLTLANTCWQAGFRREIDAGRQKAFRRVCCRLESQWHISVHELGSLQAVVMHGCIGSETAELHFFSHLSSMHQLALIASLDMIVMYFYIWPWMARAQCDSCLKCCCLACASRGMWVSYQWRKLGTRQLGSQTLPRLFLCQFSGLQN
ncbi:hypothetical protein BAE44_0003479, partial [Dichanthelium oligosanthes]